LPGKALKSFCLMPNSLLSRPVVQPARIEKSSMIAQENHYKEVQLTDE